MAKTNGAVIGPRTPGPISIEKVEVGTLFIVGAGTVPWMRVTAGAICLIDGEIHPFSHFAHGVEPLPDGTKVTLTAGRL